MSPTKNSVSSADLAQGLELPAYTPAGPSLPPALRVAAEPASAPAPAQIDLDQFRQMEGIEEVKPRTRGFRLFLPALALIFISLGALIPSACLLYNAGWKKNDQAHWSFAVPDGFTYHEKEHEVDYKVSSTVYLFIDAAIFGAAFVTMCIAGFCTIFFTRGFTMRICVGLSVVFGVCFGIVIFFTTSSMNVFQGCFATLVSGYMGIIFGNCLTVAEIWGGKDLSRILLPWAYQSKEGMIN